MYKYITVVRVPTDIGLLVQLGFPSDFLEPSKDQVKTSLFPDPKLSGLAQPFIDAVVKLKRPHDWTTLQGKSIAICMTCTNGAGDFTFAKLLYKAFEQQGAKPTLIFLPEISTYWDKPLESFFTEQLALEKQKGTRILFGKTKRFFDPPFLSDGPNSNTAVAFTPDIAVTTPGLKQSTTTFSTNLFKEVPRLWINEPGFLYKDEYDRFYSESFTIGLGLGPDGIGLPLPLANSSIPDHPAKRVRTKDTQHPDMGTSAESAGSLHFCYHYLEAYRDAYLYLACAQEKERSTDIHLISRSWKDTTNMPRSILICFEQREPKFPMYLDKQLLGELGIGKVVYYAGPKETTKPVTLDVGAGKTLVVEDPFPISPEVFDRYNSQASRTIQGKSGMNSLSASIVSEVPVFNEVLWDNRVMVQELEDFAASKNMLLVQAFFKACRSLVSNNSYQETYPSSEVTVEGFRDEASTNTNDYTRLSHLIHHPLFAEQYKQFCGIIQSERSAIPLIFNAVVDLIEEPSRISRL